MILLRLAYLGTNYHGFQVQPNAVTVQECLQNAIESVFGTRYNVKGCSRTDSGVHANEYFCTVETDPKIPIEKIPSALNSRLPRDISVYECFSVDENFHPRYNVKYKEYEYLIWNEKRRNPFMLDRAYHYPRELDINIMREAAGYFTGSHDFAGFMSSGSDVTDTVRDIKYLDISENNELISIKIAADGFLYNMVRIIVGTLIYVSEGKILPTDIEKLISGKDRAKLGKTVPPHGLYLNKVYYGDLNERSAK